MNIVVPSKGSFGLSKIPKLTSEKLRARKTIVVAWSIEIVCIAIGFMLAAAIGIEALDRAGVGGWDAAFFAAAPFAGAAIAEIARIPFVETFFKAHRHRWKVLALGMVLVCSVLTAENLLFGFERAFTVRVEAVRKKNEEVIRLNEEASRLEAKSKSLLAERQELEAEQTRLRAQRKDAENMTIHGDAADAARVAGQIKALEQQIAALDEQIRHLPTQHKEALARCDKMPIGRCDSKATQLELEGEARKLRQQRADLNDALRKLLERNNDGVEKREAERRKELDRLGGRIRELNAKLDASRQYDQTVREDLDAAKGKIADAAKDAEAALNTSQMHRLAKVIFGANDAPTTMKMATIFSLVIAVVMSLTGSALAAMHFRVKYQPEQPPRTGAIRRSIRGYIARQRRKHSVVKKVEVPVVEIKEVEKEVERIVEVPVEKIVEKEVERIREVPIEKIVLVKTEVPVEQEKVVIRRVEVPKPEIVLVPVPLEASEEARRRIMQQAARAHTATIHSVKPAAAE